MTFGSPAGGRMALSTAQHQSAAEVLKRRSQRSSNTPSLSSPPAPACSDQLRTGPCQQPPGHIIDKCHHEQQQQLSCLHKAAPVSPVPRAAAPKGSRLSPLPVPEGSSFPVGPVPATCVYQSKPTPCTSAEGDLRDATACHGLLTV